MKNAEPVTLQTQLTVTRVFMDSGLQAADVKFVHMAVSIVWTKTHARNVFPSSDLIKMERVFLSHSIPAFKVKPKLPKTALNVHSGIR